MKNTSLKSYIYKVTNFETGRYYIGSQCSGKTIGVNYFTSSKNKEFREDFKTYGEEKYKIEIIKEFEDPEECVDVENYMIRDHMQLKDGLCLNRGYVCGNKKIFSRLGTHPKVWNKGVHLSEETRQKMSRAKKGIPLSEEHRQKISRAQKGHPGWNKGVHLSEETRQKMSKANKGRPGWNRGIPWSEGHRKKMSITSPRRRKISIEGVVFGSLTEAAQYYNVCIATISYWIKTGKHNAFLIEK